jgi:hypothetical protein
MEGICIKSLKPRIILMDDHPKVEHVSILIHSLWIISIIVDVIGGWYSNTVVILIKFV